MEEAKPKYVECVCRGHSLRLELVDWAREDWTKDHPGVYLSFWEQGHLRDHRLSFWDRVKYAWREFKGKMTQDDFVIHEREKLVELRNALSILITEWDILEKRIEEERANVKTPNP